MENQKRSKFSRLAELTLVFSIVIPLAIIIVFTSSGMNTCHPSSNAWIFEIMFYVLTVIYIATVIVSILGFIFALINKASALTRLEYVFSFFISIFFAYIFLMSITMSGRCKTQDAAIKSNIESTRVAGELWYDVNDYSYEYACNNADFQRILPLFLPREV